MSTSAYVFLRFLLCVLFYYNKNAFALNSPPQLATYVKCLGKERQALLSFKQQLTGMDNRLSSWGHSGEHQMDCCEWHGVHCDNQTGNVIKLDLRGPADMYNNAVERLHGEISPSLLELKYLDYLDLSCNDFNGRIPQFFGSFTRLKFLNLSSAGFDGLIPNQLGNLSSLRTLDLSLNDFLSCNNLGLLSPLQSLRNLYLQGINLENATGWINAVSSLPTLRVLHLSHCRLPPVTASSLNSVSYLASLTHLDISSNDLGSSVYIWLFNFSNSLIEVNLSNNNLRGPISHGFANIVSLMHLDLSQNKLDGVIPSYFGDYGSLNSLLLSHNNLEGHMPELVKNLSKLAPRTLEYLHLDGNLISGPLPDTIVKFSSLKELRLSLNKLNGSMPKALGQLPNLTVLDLTGNEITGPVPDFLLPSSLRELYLAKNQLGGVLTKSIGLLSNLERLYLSSNNLEGEISEAHLLNLSRLQILDLSFNSLLELRIRSGWMAPFRLNVLRLAHCNIGPHFPKWLQFQSNVSEIDISDAGISGDIPSWFWDQISDSKVLNLSYNLMSGNLPDLFAKVSGLLLVDLSSNNFDGPVPRLPDTVTVVDFSKNKFSGRITFLCNSSYDNLGYLDLSDNHLFGELPDCWDELPMLIYLNLANNDLSGKIPGSMGSSGMIMTLQLRNNNFTGELPKSWQYVEQLNFVDLGQNRLSGSIPAWVGANLSNVVVLSLSSNCFSGSIDRSICNLSRIQILDLSGNQISGTIPKCINYFSALAQEYSSRKSINHWYWYKSPVDQIETNISYSEKAFLTWKGKESQYKSTLGLVKSIDLSSNNLTGDIPLEMTSLIGLLGLNLSRNHLTGTLAPEIGKLELLNFLDLSKNQLSGEIPSSLSQLSHLGILDMSFNNFTGRIPTSTHLKTFSNSSYVGNPRLCGEPLTQACPGDELPQNPSLDERAKEHEEEFVTTGFYVSMALGFIFGFWGVCGTLFLNRSLRHAFFQLINNIQDWLYVITILNLSRLRRRLQGG